MAKKTTTTKATKKTTATSKAKATTKAPKAKAGTPKAKRAETKHEVVTAVLEKQANKYPFRTKAQILEHIMGSDAALKEAVLIIEARHALRESGEPVTGSHGWPNSWGRTPSHPQRRVALKFLEGQATEGEVQQVRDAMRSLVKQLAAHARSEALRNDPSLAEHAARFFAPGSLGTPVPAPVASKPRARRSRKSAEVEA
jgi:hypothetical protein